MERFTLNDYHAIYPQARERGFVEWSPRPETAAVVDAVQTVLTEYRDHLPLTLRQVFYRLVGAHGYDKTEKAYKRLGEYLNRARRARLIPFGAIRDDGEAIDGAGGWASESAWWETIRSSAAHFELHPRTDQELDVVFLVEAAGMVPQVARVAHDYGIDVRSSGGFNSVTVTHGLASRAARSDRPVVFLHVGDYDPSGESVFYSLAADVTLFARRLSRVAEPPAFYRVAVTEDQVAEYDLPSAPAKRTDRRGDWHTGKLDATQAEAFTPVQLAEIIREACIRFTDLDVLDVVHERSEAISARIVSDLEELAPEDE